MSTESPGGAAAPALAAESISVSYGKVRALRNLSLEVADQEIVCLLGANGAGKSTLLNALSGVVPKTGQVRLHGEDITRLTPWTAVERGLAHVPEGRQVFPELTVDAHLVLAERSRDGQQLFSREYVYELFDRLRQRRRQLAGNLSGGEQQMLAIGRALVTQPRVLLLDEPSLGLAPLLAQTVLSTLGELRSRGLSVLLVEQNATLALSVSDRVYVLTTGEVTTSGSTDEISASSDIRKAYLGG
jgi:branched-chain amino acid transport system ATP-binding protein